MQIESIKLKRFRAFADMEIDQLPRLCVFIGANGTGKSTLFHLFGFLKEAFTSNIRTALHKLGGNRGLDEVRSRGTKGPIEITLKFREKPGQPLVTYFLSIDNDKKSRMPVVEREILKYRRGSHGQPWHFLDFKKGVGSAVTNELEDIDDIKLLERKDQTLKSPDILAVRGLSQFKEFPAVRVLGDLIENWHVSDFHINRARPEQEAGYAEHLSTEGENLSLVTEFLHAHHQQQFQTILAKLSARVPGIENVETKITEEGRVLLKFKDGAFEDPFLARHVSDGTIKMFAYLILLYDPNPHPLLCVEEPENQLYPSLLWELAEEFRSYANRGGQVFVSTHSPDFMNALGVDEVFWLSKKEGLTHIQRAQDDPQVKACMDAGDQMGYLWKEGLFESVEP
ncbi:MAG: AAA family ATPase [Magnetococcales bacterium]|nr:AAA family ATPase [Magnetococcales bacterium]